MSKQPKTPPDLMPPPHLNAKVHARIMAKLSKMTPEEIFQSAVRAGIYTPDGKLTEHYRDPDEPDDAKR